MDVGFPQNMRSTKETESALPIQLGRNALVTSVIDDTGVWHVLAATFSVAGG